ncbi:hypothetical protein ACFLU4_01680 [Chloroflexota bacterium]
MWYGSRRLKIYGITLAILLIISSVLIACAGPAGSAGPAGPAGPRGPAGAPGKDATLSTARVTVSPLEIPTSLKGVALDVSGVGFMPGEVIEMFIPKSIPLSDIMVDGSLEVGSCIVNEQGAFSCTVKFSSRWRTIGEGVYSLTVDGSKGSIANVPLLVKAPAE